MLPQIPVVSVSIPVDSSCKYEGLPTFNQFGDTITFVGGINRPKLVQCFDRWDLLICPSFFEPSAA